MTLFGVFQIVATILFVILIFMMILPARGVKQITTETLHEKLTDESIQFIDVRKPLKFQQFHIPKFRNIPIKEIRKEAKNLSKDKEVVLICQTGSAANRASKKLKRKGFHNLTIVRGGLSTWEPVRILK